MMKNKVLTICLSVIVFMGLLLVITTTKIEYDKYLKEYNITMYEIIGLIKEKYPSIRDEEIVAIINGKKNSKNIDIGRELVQKYGIANNAVILKLENIYKENIIVNCITVSLVLGLIIICIVLYKKYEKGEINKITKYIKEINDKNYSLKIKENTEDDLTNLRNELYKITLMLREEAENSEKDKLNLATSLSDISHQIKTPLTSISIMLDEIKENIDMDNNIKQKFIFEISRQIEQISFLTITILKLSKLDADAIKFENKKFELKKLIANILKNLEVPIELKRQNIVEEIDNCSITGDYRWTLEAITNIIKNCIEHNQNDKSIYIKTKDTSLYVELIIQDEGEGIPKEDLKHIFERFYKGKNSKEDSFGIGLALAKSILEKQNATIYCASKENEGTIFRIRWMKR